MQNSSHAHRRYASWKLANQLHAFCCGGLDDVIAHDIIPYTSSLFGQNRFGHRDVDGACITFINSNFSELHAAVSGLHSAQSRVVEGLLLACDWSVWAEPVGQVTALVVFERLDARSDESVSVQFKQNWTIRTDDPLQNRLSAIRRLQAQLELLCELNKAQLITTQPLARVGTLTHCRRYQLGGRRYAHIGLTHTSLHTHTLVLCSPLKEPCNRTHTAHQSLTSHSPCPNLLQCILNNGDVIPVGGAFEFMLHHSLLYSNCGDHESRRLLAEAVLSVPRSLHTHRPKDFLQHLGSSGSNCCSII
ncbi:hypothetical protein Baya_15613 [Bagarius yarrelli]|uniref:Uncharacterized protein n=1 Tax=Bagarius yarrelli TaxID=175774 RepID=A0A556VC42_BAGYA|nr:hypothetical protein Baya_15613 [Bagarius yarrelli]